MECDKVLRGPPPPPQNPRHERGKNHSLWVVFLMRKNVMRGDRVAVLQSLVSNFALYRLRY